MSKSQLWIGVVGLAISILTPMQLSSSTILDGGETRTEESSNILNEVKLQDMDFVSVHAEHIEDVEEEEWIEVNLHISFYTDLQSENTAGKETTDAQGNKLVYGTIAIPRDLPLGTALIIDGFDGEFTGRDRGSKKYIKWLDSNTMKIDMHIPRNKKESDSTYYKRVNHMGVVKTTGKYLLPKEG